MLRINNTNSCIKSENWIFNSNKKPKVFINFNEKKNNIKTCLNSSNKKNEKKDLYIEAEYKGTKRYKKK